MDGVSGETQQITFAIEPDSGLTAETYGESDFAVLPGEPVTLKVKASHDTTDVILYTWYHFEFNSETGSEDYYVEDSNGLSDTVTITDPISTWYYCTVSDKIGRAHV